MGTFKLIFIITVGTLQVPSIVGQDTACYSYLGCFPMGPPWATILRPLPAPQAPEVIATTFYLYTRNQLARYYVTKLPDISLDGSDYDGHKPTFIITHGFTHDGNQTWISDLAYAYLNRVDANVIIVDWGHGAKEINYLQVASNTRVVAAEIARLCYYLLATKGASESRIHLAGHSLGSQIMSYVGKAIPNIARLTALDPAQPGFEGYEKEVRLDITDAQFVEVIHSNGAPFFPTLGVGMVGTYGHVDFYMNGGMVQPGCVLPPIPSAIYSLMDLAYLPVEEIANFVACPHQRSYQYFTDSLANPHCTYWGRRSMDVIFNLECRSTSCSPMGLEAINYPARGAFYVFTGIINPYCSRNSNADIRMAPYMNQSSDTF